MGDFFRSWKFKIIVAVLALLVGLMLFMATRIGKEGGASVIGTILEPFQRFSTSISNTVTGWLDNITNAQAYADDNERLKEQLSEMYAQIIDYDKLKKENEELRALIGQKEQSPDITFSEPCAIISRTTNDPYGSFVIDKGSKDGIALWDPVITTKGLVGIVDSVAGTYARVQTILSPEVPVGAYCVDTKDTGVVEGRAAKAALGQCVMTYIDRDSTIKAGDVVVSSGSSGLFPADRVIGTVTEVAMEESGLSLTAVIQPVEDIMELTSVFVITSFNGQGEQYGE